MLAYLAQRGAVAGLVLIGVVALVFVITPTFADPARLMLPIDAERAELNSDKRAEILKQIAKMFQDEAIMIPITQQNWIYGLSPKLKFKPLPNGQTPVNRMTLNS